MGTLTRFELGMDGYMEPSENGDYVYADDAMAEIEALRAENAQLKESRRELDLLYAAGVDNWEGYEDALAEGGES